MCALQMFVLLLLLSRSEDNVPMDFPSFPGNMARRFADVTVICPLADSYTSAAARDAGAAAELAASRKEVKYVGLDGRYLFAPIAFENLGVPSASTRQLFSYLGGRLIGWNTEQIWTDSVPDIMQVQRVIRVTAVYWVMRVTWNWNWHVALTSNKVMADLAQYKSRHITTSRFIGSDM